MKTDPNSRTQNILLREYFAAMAMQGLLANGNIINNNTKSAGEYVAAASVDLADALITALNK